MSDDSPKGWGALPPTLDQTFTDAAAAGAKLHTFMSMPPGFAGSWMCIFSKERPGGSPLPFRSGWGTTPQAAAAEALRHFLSGATGAAAATIPPPGPSARRAAALRTIALVWQTWTSNPREAGEGLAPQA